MLLSWDSLPLEFPNGMTVSTDVDATRSEVIGDMRTPHLQVGSIDRTSSLAAQTVRSRVPWERVSTHMICGVGGYLGLVPSLGCDFGRRQRWSRKREFSTRKAPSTDALLWLGSPLPASRSRQPSPTIRSPRPPISLPWFCTSADSVSTSPFGSFFQKRYVTSGCDVGAKNAPHPPCRPCQTPLLRLRGEMSSPAWPALTRSRVCLHSSLTSC